VLYKRWDEQLSLSHKEKKKKKEKKKQFPSQLAHSDQLLLFLLRRYKNANVQIVSSWRRLYAPSPPPFTDM
jgi:hypothetical protein